MSIPPGAEILILAGQEATARRWAVALCDSGSRIWLAAEDVPDPSRLELIVTDQDAPLSSQTWASQEWQLGDTAGRGVRPGVIRVGVEGAGDVRLPADVSDREIQLACRLLAEVVRLRRKDHTLTQTRNRLVEQALTDPLTGLANRRAWDRVLQEQLTTAGSSGTRLCLAILDLDHFKRVNDAHGHAAGDDVLRATGKVISDGLRDSDFVARLGGDEFGLLLCVRDEAMARAVVERVRRSLPSGLTRSGTHVVTASAGFAIVPSGEPPSPLPSPGALFDAADAALSKAKGQGRDRTVNASEVA
jgi:diguanylate cyclase (GGDEF)-like protein